MQNAYNPHRREELAALNAIAEERNPDPRITVKQAWNTLRRSILRLMVHATISGSDSPLSDRVADDFDQMDAAISGLTIDRP